MAFRSKSAAKRVRSSRKRRARNLEAKKTVKNAFKQAERAVAGKSPEARELVKKAVSVMDRAVERGIIHRNKAARQKSRLLLKFNKLKG